MYIYIYCWMMAVRIKTMMTWWLKSDNYLTIQFCWVGSWGYELYMVVGWWLNFGLLQFHHLVSVFGVRVQTETDGIANEQATITQTYYFLKVHNYSKSRSYNNIFKLSWVWSPMNSGHPTVFQQAPPHRGWFFPGIPWSSPPGPRTRDLSWWDLLLGW